MKNALSEFDAKTDALIAKAKRLARDGGYTDHDMLTFSIGYLASAAVSAREDLERTREQMEKYRKLARELANKEAA